MKKKKKHWQGGDKSIYPTGPGNYHPGDDRGSLPGPDLDDKGPDEEPPDEEPPDDSDPGDEDLGPCQTFDDQYDILQGVIDDGGVSCPDGYEPIIKEVEPVDGCPALEIECFGEAPWWEVGKTDSDEGDDDDDSSGIGRSGDGSGDDTGGAGSPGGYY